MPYIAPESRPAYDHEIELLISKLRTSLKKDGDVNYVISRIVAGTFKPDAGWSYETASDGTKAFEAAGTEFYRRVLAPYEDKGIVKNGDIPEYMS